MAESVTELVEAAGSGDGAAMRRLFETVYGELKRIARRQLAGGDATLDTTGLVHEAFLKLVNPDRLALRDRRHFFVVAAKAMRQIVIDRARRRLAGKRGGGLAPIAMTESDEPPDAMSPETLLRLDRALDALTALEPRLAELVELRYFAGLDLDSIAQSQHLTLRTVQRDWRRAKAFLFDAVRDA